MSYKIFDVVELHNGKKGTIVNINKGEIAVDIVDESGISHGFANVKQKDVKRIIITNNWQNFPRGI